MKQYPKIETASGAPADRWWLIAGTIALCFIIAVAPIGYIGGTYDDWRYLNTIRCWREFGPCLPQDHWQGRWPVIAPIAIITGLLGETRLTISIWPLAASIASLLALARIGNLAVGRPIGWIAAIMLVFTPAFSTQLLTPRAESIELAFVLLGVLFAIKWSVVRKLGLAAMAGLMLALAFQTRETSIVALVFTAIFALTRQPRLKWSEVACAMAGFLLPLAVELIVFVISTGDPLWRLKLSVAHTLMLSPELLGPGDPNAPPFFNKSYIANWRHETGIHVHWAIDGLLNLFLNGKAGLAFWLTPLLLMATVRQHSLDVRRKIWNFWLISVGYASALIYALAIDPKPRMMLPAICAVYVAISLLSWRLFCRGSKGVAIAAWVTTALIGAGALWASPRTQLVEEKSADWIAELPGQIEIDENTRRHLTLVPVARSLPGLDSRRQFWMFYSQKSCEDWLIDSDLPPGSLLVVRSAATSEMAKFGNRWSGSLCLFQYSLPLPAHSIELAIRFSRRDGPYALLPRKVYPPPG